MKDKIVFFIVCTTFFITSWLANPQDVAAQSMTPLELRKTGIVRVIKNTNGQVTAMKLIITSFDIQMDEGAKQLVAMDGQTVRVTGTRIDEDGKRILTVKSVEPVAGSGEVATEKQVSSRSETQNISDNSSQNNNTDTEAQKQLKELNDTQQTVKKGESSADSDKNITDAKQQYEMGLKYLLGKGVPMDSSKAVEWWLKASNQGDARAQYGLGRCYYLGNGVPKNITKSVEWFQKAAAQGNAEAQNMLGSCYDAGEGVTQDTSEAVKWYRMAAEQGHTRAQCSLGLCYATGQGAPKDLSEAVVWLRKAADQGNADAQKALNSILSRYR